MGAVTHAKLAASPQPARKSGAIVALRTGRSAIETISLSKSLIRNGFILLDKAALSLASGAGIG